MNSEKEKNLKNGDNNQAQPEPGYVSLAQASKFSPYSQEYLSLLARKGKIHARKFGRNWYTTKEAIAEYLSSQGIKIVLPKHLFDSSYKGKINRPFDFLFKSTPMGEEKPKPIFTGSQIKPEPEGERELKDETGGEGEREFQKELEEEKKVFKRFLNLLEKKRAAEKTAPQKFKEFRKKADQQFRSPIRAIAIAILVIVIIFLLIGGISFGRLDWVVDSIYTFFKDAETLKGHFPGTHANEVLLLDNNGNISIYGHIETKGQLRSWVKQGVAPIVVDSTTTVENLSVDYLDNLSSQDFTLAFVTKNGNITYEDVKLEGKVEVGKTLTVKGATKLLDSLFVYGNLGAFGDITGEGNLEIAGIAKIGGKLFALGGINTKGANLDLGKGTIILTNRNLIPNLNADMVDSMDASDFTLDFVTSQGNTTANKINVGGLSVSGSSDFQGVTFHHAGLWGTDGSFSRSLGTGGSFSATGRVTLGDGEEKVVVRGSNWSVSKDGDISVATLSVDSIRDPVTFQADVTLASPANLTLNAGDITVSQLSAPSGVSTSTTTGGSLAAGTYYYIVTALNSNGETTGSSEVSATVDGTTINAVEISWDEVSDATSYRIYQGATSSQENIYFKDSDGSPFLDTGSSGTTGTVPTQNTTGGSGTFYGGLSILGTTISRSILPETDSFYNLGSPTFSWANLYTDNLFAQDTEVSEDLTVSGDLKVSGTSTLATTTITHLGVGTTTRPTQLAHFSGTGNILFDNTGQVIISPTATTTLGAATSTPIVFTGYIKSDVLPYTTDQYDLGSTKYNWQDLYATAAHFGAALDITGTKIDASGNLTLEASGTMSVTSSGAFDIDVAGTERLNIDTSGNITLTGGIVLDGSATTTGDFVVQGTTTLATAGGKVGIGTTTPSEALTVVGNIWGSGNLTLKGTIDTGQGATELYLMDQNVRTSDSPSFTGLTVSGGTITGANSEQLKLGVTNDVVQLMRGGSTYTVCDSSGNCQSATGGYIGGSGTSGYIPKFTGTYTIGNSIAQDNGSTVTVGGDLTVSGEDINSASRIFSKSNATMPHIVLDSTGSGDNWISQGAYISLGESGDLGSAALHMTYRGDGYGWIGSGAVSNAVPGASYLRFDYDSSNIYTPDTLTVGNLECTNCIDEGDMAQNQIDDSEIQDNSLTASSLAANSVGNSELVNDITVDYVRGINYLYGDYGTIAKSTDEWLRLNDGSSHTNGIYVPNKLRADGGLYVSDDEYIYRGAEDYIYTSDNFMVVGSAWLRVDGSEGLYFESYGGGWRMTDSTWIRAYNDKNIYTAGEIRGGTVTEGGNLLARNTRGAAHDIKITAPHTWFICSSNEFAGGFYTDGQTDGRETFGTMRCYDRR